MPSLQSRMMAMLNDHTPEQYNYVDKSNQHFFEAAFVIHVGKFRHGQCSYILVFGSPPTGMRFLGPSEHLGYS